MEPNYMGDSEPILLIEFLHPQNYFAMSFMGNDYEIIGKDDVGNYIGISLKGQIFYLEVSNHDVRYIATNTKTLIEELNLYKYYSDTCSLSENASDDELNKYAAEFEKQIRELDANAFFDENTFWAIIVEQMELGWL